MASESDLFHAYNPLFKNDPVFLRRYESTKQYSLSIRPVWIIGDLELLHDWIYSNWELDQNRYSLFQHYKNLLLSDRAQSFMVDQNGKPLIQFDVLSMQKSYLPSSSEPSGNDCYLYYLYKENFRDPEIFKKGLQCMIPFLFSFTEIHSVNLQLHRPDLAMSKLLTETGFEPSHRERSFGESLLVYRKEGDP